MKLIVHEKSPKFGMRELTATPLCIWMNRTMELQINPGDTLGAVVTTIRKHWTAMPPNVAAGVVALWFSMGERVAHQTHHRHWTTRERDRSLTRAYLARPSK